MGLVAWNKDDDDDDDDVLSQSSKFSLQHAIAAMNARTFENDSVSKLLTVNVGMATVPYSWWFAAACTYSSNVWLLSSKQWRSQQGPRPPPKINWKELSSSIYEIVHTVIC